MEESVKRKALALHDEGQCSELYELLKPYIEKEDGLALHLYSTFSLLSFNESEEAFNQRSIQLKIKASEKGIAQASYRMGVNYLYGDDGVIQSYVQASLYFERAILQGHSYTKFTFGHSLYYGTYGNEMDKVRGLKLLQEASSEGIRKAEKALEEINHTQQ